MATDAKKMAEEMDSDVDSLLGSHLTRRQMYELRTRGLLTRDTLQQLKKAGAERGLPAMHRLFHELVAERPLEADEFKEEPDGN